MSEEMDVHLYAEGMRLLRRTETVARTLVVRDIAAYGKVKKKGTRSRLCLPIKVTKCCESTIEEQTQKRKGQELLKHMSRHISNLQQTNGID